MNFEDEIQDMLFSQEDPNPVRNVYDKNTTPPPILLPVNYYRKFWTR